MVEGIKISVALHNQKNTNKKIDLEMTIEESLTMYAKYDVDGEEGLSKDEIRNVAEEQL